MKKTLLTFIACGFAGSVSFAQTAPSVESSTQVPQEQVVVEAEQGERKQVKMEELPTAVKEAFNKGEHKNMEVLAIYVQPAAESAEAAVFEFELAKKSSEAASEEGTANLEIERVSERQPDVILHINENGELLEEKDLDAVEAPKNR